jgi:hypothetical protein
MKRIFTLFSLLLLAIVGHAQYRYLAGTLQASQAGPGIISDGTGVVIVRYNTLTRLLEHFGNYRNLSANISNQHIHTGAPGVSGIISVPLTGSGGTFGSLTGSKVLTVAEEADLLAGNMYTNVHTSAYPGGEVRAQLTLTTDGQTELLNARLQGAQSVPPNGSLGTGNVTALIDKATHMLYLTGTYSGLTTAASDAHIHVGAPGSNGGVIVPLKFVAQTSGTLDTSKVITTTNEASILAGNTYVNVHTSTVPGGEIRGQLTKLSQVRYLANALEGSQQFPVNASTARGTVIVKYDTSTKVLELVGDYQNLNNTISGSHIHGPFGPPGTNAGVLFTLTNTGGNTGTLSGTFTLTPSQETDLLAGNMYANVHSTGTYSGGEIRAQLLPTSAGETQYLVGTLQASQSVATPAVVSPGTGSATVLLDKITNKVYVTGNFSGLTSNITATHIHGGAAGTNGGVVVGLNFGGTTSGTITGTATVRPTFADSLVRGLTYLNIHTTNFSQGEIRAQLGDLVLPVKLLYFNGYKLNNETRLLWQTAQETNTARYEVEQQNLVNGTWVNRGSVLATGTASKYSYTDIPTLLKSKYVFYRLKIIDKDGRFSYSPTIKINFGEGKSELTILQNPVSDHLLKYSITGLSADTQSGIAVMDVSGKTLIKTTSNSFATNSIDISQLPAGLYHLVIHTTEGILQKAFMK